MPAISVRRHAVDVLLVLPLALVVALLLCVGSGPVAARVTGQLPAAASLSPPSSFLLEWEAYNGVRFNQPEGIAVGDLGDVFVTDAGNGRVVKFSPSGQSLTSWDAAGVPGGAFAMLKRIAADASGLVYTAESRRIQRFVSNGDPVDQWPGTADDGKPVKLHGIAVDADGNVYVTDRSYGRALKFNPDGDFVAKFGLYGIDPDNFQDPVDIAVGPSRSVYVLDRTHVHMLSPSLRMEATWGSEGTGPGQFSGAEGIAVGGDGLVYVADSGNARVQVFTMYGDYLRQFGVGADAEGCFLHPRDVAVASSGTIYVLDSGRQCVLKFGLGGTVPVTDKTPPRTRVYGVDKKWHNTPVEMHFVVDEDNGVRSMQMRLQDRLLPLWSPWAPLQEVDDPIELHAFEFTLRPLADHSVDGERLFEYRSVDLAGNVEKAKRVTVLIDTRAPRVTNVKVKPARAGWDDRVTVTFRVQEQLSPKVRITGVVYEPRDEVVVVHGAESGWMSRKGLFGWSFTCRLKPGRYKVAVQVRDLAGNLSDVTTQASADLVVK